MNGPLLKYQLVSHSFEDEANEVVEWEGTETQAVLTSLAPYQRWDILWLSSCFWAFSVGELSEYFLSTYLCIYVVLFKLMN